MERVEVSVPRCPAGRFRRHCLPESAAGEAFRDDVLVPALEGGAHVVVTLNSAMGIPPSWAEEAFGGLVRKLGVEVVDRLSFVAEDAFLEGRAETIREFMADEVARQTR